MQYYHTRFLHVTLILQLSIQNMGILQVEVACHSYNVMPLWKILINDNFVSSTLSSYQIASMCACMSVCEQNKPFTFSYSMIVCIGAAIVAGPSIYYVVLIWTSITSTYFMVRIAQQVMHLSHTFTIPDSVSKTFTTAHFRGLRGRWQS